MISHGLFRKCGKKNMYDYEAEVEKVEERDGEERCMK